MKRMERVEERTLLALFKAGGVLLHQLYKYNILQRYIMNLYNKAIYNIPFFSKLIQRKRSVSRTGGGQFHDRPSCQRQQVFLIKPTGFCAIAENSFNRCMFQYLSDVAGNDVSDAAVRGSNDVTALDDIPDGDAMRKKQILFFGNRGWYRGICQQRQQLPETVPGMAVKKLLLPGFDGWEGAQNENSGAPVIDGRKGMGYMLVAGEA